MDKNSVTGIVLIMAMLLGYQYFFAPKEPIGNQKIKIEASAPQKNKIVQLNTDSSIKANSVALTDTLIKEELSVLENNEVKIVTSNMGARIISVQLKNFKSYKNYKANIPTGLFIFDSKKDIFNVEIPTNSAKINLNALAYTLEKKDGEIFYTSVLPSGKKIKVTYKLADKGYQLGYGIDVKEIADQISGNEYQIHWKENVIQNEKDVNEERKATINFLLTEDEEFDNLTESPTVVETENITKSTDWIAFKKKYFVTGLIPEGSKFLKASITSTPNLTDTIHIKTLDAQITGATQDLKQGKSNFNFYFGPNDYSIVKSVAPSFGKNVKLSYDFLLPITRYIFVPLFEFLESIFSNYGLLIIVLVLIIKTALLPLTYKSYVSMAKTRILAPEIAAIKEKIGDDAAKVQQETMKLYAEVGVNPLSGCVPVLATMPVLMAVFMLFPNLINLRQESFLWAEDLSTFDSIVSLPFTIPFYGSHVSLFCLLMTVSQLAYGYYNNQITPDQPGQPINMKMMAYFTPVIFMFVMNSFPAGLSFYYFISNLVTIGQQLAIRKFVNEDKIKLILDENRKKIAASGGAKKSRFSQYLQTQMKTMEETQKNAKNTPKKKK